MLATLTLPLADYDFGHMGDWSAGWWIVMVISMVIVWGLIVVGIVWIVRELSGRDRQRVPGPRSER
jgi:uncharacterized membrane protein